MLPKRRKAPKMDVRQSTVIRSESHKQWIRQFCCILFGKDGHSCAGKTEAAHVRSLTDGGMGMKPGDNWVIPLCSGAHAEQHHLGEFPFEHKYRIDMKAIAERLWSLSPARKKMEMQR